MRDILSNTSFIADVIDRAKEEDLVFYKRNHRLIFLVNDYLTSNIGLDGRIYEEAGLFWPLGNSYEKIYPIAKTLKGFNEDKNILFVIIDRKKWMLFKIKTGF